MQMSDLPLPPGYNQANMELAAQKLMAKDGIHQEPMAPSVPDLDASSNFIDSSPEPTVEHTVEAIEQVETIKVETPQAKNFKELKQQMLRMQKERDVLARQLSETIQRPQTFPADTLHTEVPYYKDDEYIEAKHVNALAKQLADVQNQLKQFKSQSTVSLAEQRLRMEFSDFGSVFTPENCQTLSLLDPDLALSIDADSDPYRKAKLAYRSIKNMGIDTQDTFVEEKQRIQANAAKPKTMVPTAVQSGTSPLSRAASFENGLTPALQKQLQREMAEARKGL
jgi:hypothetical protein